MKKTVSVFMSILFIMLVFIFPVSAKEKVDKIVIQINDDISGLDYTDYDKIAVILSDNLDYNKDVLIDSLQINDSVGNVYLEKLKPGRTYNLTYSFVLKPEYEYPEELNESNIEFICSKNCNVYWYGIAIGSDRYGNKSHFISVWAEVTVKGNFFQRVFGKLADFFLKVMSWSPY